MKKKFWIGILAAVLLLNLLPGMTPSASADDASSWVFYDKCENCGRKGDFPIIKFFPTPISSTPDPEYHWARVKCTYCDYEYQFSSWQDMFKHTGGTETPTCTTGKTCKLCGAKYGILGHDWTAWTSNGDNTHTRTCRRDGCGETETGNCNSSTAHCGMTGACDVCGGEYYHSEHHFGPPWKYGYDENSHWHACYYCENGKDAVSDHWFGLGNMYLASPATCVSKPVYYKNCGTCYYKGTETYVYEWGNFDPNNHTGNEEIRGAVEATCAQDGYTGEA